MSQLVNRLAAACTTTLFQLRHRAQRLPDRGYSTEAIAVTAFLIALALLALGILGDKLIDKINGIHL